MTSNATGRVLPRPFGMHWGSGFIVEEASAETPYHEPTIQLLEYEDGSQTLRFCFYRGSRFGRGPMMIDAEYLPQFAESLRDAPRIRELLERMLGRAAARHSPGGRQTTVATPEARERADL
jgi:hypothetical protein